LGKEFALTSLSLCLLGRWKGKKIRIDHMTQPDILNLAIHKEICFSNHKNEFKEKIMEQ